MIMIPVEKYEKQMLGDLLELMRFESVKAEGKPGMPYGEECFRALEFMLNRAKSMGFEVKNLEGHMGVVYYGDGEETLAILSHLDVVPAGEGWETNPFEPVVKDGKIIGRGAVDDKGGAISSLYALYAVKEAGIKLNKKIKLFFGCDEESGWGDIDYFKAHYPDPEYVITPDAGFPMINREKGLLHILLKARGESAGVIKNICSGSRPNIVPNKAKCVLAGVYDINEKDALPAKLTVNVKNKETELFCEGKASHGSHPEEGINALMYLLKAVKGAGLDGRNAADRIASCLIKLIGNEIDGASLGIKQKDELVGELTVNVGAMEGDALCACAKIDIRTPIETDLEELFNTLKYKFAIYGIECENMHMQNSHYVDENSFIVRKLKEAYEICFNEKCECLPCAGATYARAFKTGVAFGPCAIDADRGEHGPNEFIYVEELDKLARALFTAMVKAAGDEI